MKTESKGKPTIVRKLFKNEVKCLTKCKHDNIWKLIDFSEKSTFQHSNTKTSVAYIALEYAENGEIFDFILDTGRFSEPVTRYYFKQLISALECIHGKGYAHRDIKPENILLDKTGNLKLADFGFSTNRLSTSRKGTIGYMAPEILAGQVYDSRVSDIFSAGVVLFIMCTQFWPFVNADKNDRCFNKIINGQWDDLWQMYTSQFDSEILMDDSFRDLFQKLVEFNPNKRITIEEIKMHSWFNGTTATNEQIENEIAKRKSMMDSKTCSSTRVSTATKDSSTASEVNKVNLSLIHKKSSNVELIKDNKRYTKFLWVEDPEIMIKALIDFTKLFNFRVVKSKDLYRVGIIAQYGGEKIKIIANILKKQSENYRCIQLYNVNGSQVGFENIFDQLQAFLSDQKYDEELPK